MRDEVAGHSLESVSGREAPVITLRCTQRLLTKLARDAEDVDASGRLGDWYANPLRAGRRRLVLCTNERTLLSVVVLLAPVKELVTRLRIAAQHRIRQIPAPSALLVAEIGALADIRVGPTRSRSVLASMNQLGTDAEVWLESRPTGDLEMLGHWLCDRPCSALRTHWPWYEAELLLTGAVRAAHVKIRPPRRVT